MMKQHKLIVMIALLLLGLIACRPNSEPEPAETDGGQPAEQGENDGAPSGEPAEESNDGGETAAAETLLFAVNGWERGRFETVVEQFEAEYPAIDVELITVEEVVGNQGLYGPAGDPTEGLLKLVQGADVLNTYFDPVMVREGLFLDLAPLLDGDPEINREDFFPGVLEQYSVDGRIIGIPFRSGYGLVFYNKDLFDAAGLDYPEPGWTWDDMLARAQALTRQSGGETSQWGVHLQNFGHLTVLLSQGVIPYEQNGPLYEPRFEDPAVRAGIEEYLSWYYEEEVAPIESWDEETGQMLISGVPNDMGVYGLIDAGQVGMWLEYSDAWQYRREQGNFELGVAPYPANERTQNTTPALPYGNLFLISAGTSKAEAAWQLIRYMTDHIDEMSAPYEASALPARRSVAEEIGYWDSIDPELAEALRYSADHAFASPVFSPVLGSLDGAIYAVLSDQKSLDQALADAQQEAEKYLQEQEDALSGAEPVPEFTVLEPEPVAEGVTTINFIVGGADPNVYREVADRFNEANPDILVKVREPNYFQMEEFSLATAVQDGDCFQWYGVLSAPEDQALILSPEPFLDADPELGRDFFFPAALNSLTFQGQLIGLPHEVNVTLMNYNKRLFDDAGRPYPEPGWTMDDFLETAVAMTQGDDEETRIWGFVGNPYEFGDVMAFAERFGVELLDTEADPPQVRFDSPEAAAAIRWFAELSTEYGVKPVFDMNFGRSGPMNPEDDPWMRRQAMIENDRAAIWTGDMFGMISYGPDGQPLDQDMDWIGYVPYPRGPQGGVGFDNVTGLYILAETPHRQPCWEWLKYVTADTSVINFGLPARIDTAESPEIASRLGEERVEVLIDSIANSTRGSRIYSFSNRNSWLGLTYTWLDQAYQKIVTGDATVEAALAEAQQKGTDFTACMVQQDDFTDYMVVEECAKEADPNWGQPLP